MSFYADYDARFRAAPLRDLKPPYGHLWGEGLLFVIAKNATFTGLPLLVKHSVKSPQSGGSNKDPLLDRIAADPLITVRWLIRPVVRDLAIISTTRAFERTALTFLGEEAAGLFFRGASGLLSK